MSYPGGPTWTKNKYLRVVNKICASCVAGVRQRHRRRRHLSAARGLLPGSSSGTTSSSRSRPDTCGNVNNDYNKLIKLVARVQHPGVGIEGKYDVDGLRSQAVAFARHHRGRLARQLHDHFRVGQPDLRRRGRGVRRLRA